MAGIGRAKLIIVPDILLVKDNSIHNLGNFAVTGLGVRVVAVWVVCVG
jgi:hypothetical protein